MTGGGTVPYHLRVNKYVERQLFVELLRVLLVGDLSRCTYASLGGLFLEDHRLVFNRLGIQNLLSLEKSKVVYGRQKFNVRLPLVECLNISSNDFISNIESVIENASERRLIVWLDYAVANKRGDQLAEFDRLLSRVDVADIVKITLNANPRTLHAGDDIVDDSQDDLESKGATPAVMERRRKKLIDQLGSEYLPDSIKTAEMTHDFLPLVLLNAIELAAKNGLRGHRDLVPVPVANFVYSDGAHQMLTSTITFVDRTSKDDLVRDLNDCWKYLPKSWTAFTRINLPMLSLKERLWIDEMLFSLKGKEQSLDEVHSKLPFRFDKVNRKSLSMLEAYVEHYSRYPSFMHIEV